MKKVNYELNKRLQYEIIYKERIIFEDVLRYKAGIDLLTCDIVKDENVFLHYQWGGKLTLSWENVVYLKIGDRILKGDDDNGRKKGNKKN